MRIQIPILCACMMTTLATGGAKAQSAPIRYVDAHSHFLMPVVAPDDQIELSKKAGMAAVVLIDSNPERLQAVLKRYPGYVIPFITFSRRARPAGDPAVMLDGSTAEIFKKLHDAGTVCGFGELATRMQPALDVDDTSALHNTLRLKIYELAAARAVPVLLHVDLATPEVIEAFARVAAAYPGMPLILAHAGRVAGPDAIERLLRLHSNIHIDLSNKLDPLLGWGNPPAPLGQASDTALDAQGALRPEWRRLLEAFPERFLFAMDANFAEGSNRGNHILEMAEVAHKAFAPLSRNAHEAIAHGNLERLVRGCRAWPRSRLP